MEHAAALGYVVGIEWFTLVDQSVSGRWFSRLQRRVQQHGPDRGDRSPLETDGGPDAKTNYGIYDVLFGRAPVRVRQPQVHATGGGQKT